MSCRTDVRTVRLFCSQREVTQQMLTVFVSVVEDASLPFFFCRGIMLCKR